VGGGCSEEHSGGLGLRHLWGSHPSLDCPNHLTDAPVKTRRSRVSG